MTQVKEKYGVLLDFSKVSRMSKDDLKNTAKSTEDTDKGMADIDEAEMMQESSSFHSYHQTSALGMLTFLHNNHLQEVYPNLYIALFSACHGGLC